MDFTKRFPISLKLSIPTILVLCGGILGMSSFYQEIHEAYKKTELEANNYVRVSAGQTSRILDYLYRRSDIEDAELAIISQLSSDPNLDVAMVIDDRNIVYLSNRYELRNLEASKTIATNYPNLLKNVRDKLSGDILISENRQKLIAAYPIILPVLSEELQSSRTGVLFLAYDLTRAKQEAFNDAFKRSLIFNGSLILFCLTVWGFFEITLTRRVSSLVAASNSLAEGDLAVRTELRGSDELVQISVAFDRMATKIQENAIQQFYLFDQLQEELLERKKTEAKLTESNQKLAISNEELARATRLKDEFLANMSHELRTPLNAILGMSQCFKANMLGEINDDQREAIDMIEEGGTHLLALITDILDVAKIGSGQVEIMHSLTTANSLCDSSLTFVKQQAMQKQVILHLKIAPNLPELFVDERRIRQSLINLLNNAIKFTPSGGNVLLEVRLHQNTPITEQQNLHQLPHQPQYMEFIVKDTGIGISDQNIAKLFQPFVQIDAALNRQNTGTGLGLVLVKNLVELHGGKITLSSEVGVGSCFSILLPCDDLLMRSPNPSLETMDLESDLDYEIIDGLNTILLAEDNDANRLTILKYLNAKGYELLIAKNGEEAVQYAKLHIPDLILIDIQMPKMDGLEAIRIIRNDPSLKVANIPIIAVTALTMNGDREKCLAAGANEYITKPINLSHLSTKIKQIFATQ